MRAAIYLGKKNIKMGDLPIPIAGEHDIVIKNIYASICGTDVAVYNHGPGTGHRIDVGGEFGHEMVSRVVQVGTRMYSENPPMVPARSGTPFASRG